MRVLLLLLFLMAVGVAAKGPEAAKFLLACFGMTVNPKDLEAQMRAELASMETDRQEQLAHAEAQYQAASEKSMQRKARMAQVERDMDKATTPFEQYAAQMQAAGEAARSQGSFLHEDLKQMKEFEERFELYSYKVLQ